MDLKLVDGIIRLDLDVRAYRLSAVKKAAYRFAERCTAMIGEVQEQRVHVALGFGPSVSEQAAQDVVRRFFDELLDQELREQIADETAAIRPLILAQAFSKVDVIKRS